MDTSILRTLIFLSLLLNKCKNSSKKNVQALFTSKWMSVVFSLMTELSMQLLTKAHSIQFFVETDLDQMQNRLYQRSTEPFLHQECISVSHTVFQSNASRTLGTQLSTGTFSNTKSQSQLFPPQLWFLLKSPMIRTSTTSL